MRLATELTAGSSSSHVNPFILVNGQLFVFFRCMGIANAESALEDQAKSLEKKLAETMKIHSSLQNLESQIQELVA